MLSVGVHAPAYSMVSRHVRSTESKMFWGSFAAAVTFTNGMFQHRSLLSTDQLLAARWVLFTWQIKEGNTAGKGREEGKWGRGRRVLELKATALYWPFWTRGGWSFIFSLTASTVRQTVNRTHSSHTSTHTHTQSAARRTMSGHITNQKLMPTQTDLLGHWGTCRMKTRTKSEDIRFEQAEGWVEKRGKDVWLSSCFPPCSLKECCSHGRTNPTGAIKGDVFQLFLWLIGNVSLLLAIGGLQCMFFLGLFSLGFSTPVFHCLID